jgi:hypothetical protein
MILPWLVPVSPVQNIFSLKYKMYFTSFFPIAQQAGQVPASQYVSQIMTFQMAMLSFQTVCIT